MNTAPGAVFTGAAVLGQEELERRIQRLMGQLAATGVGPGSVAAVATDDPLYTLELFHSLPRLGAALYPLDPAQPPARRDRLLAQAGVEHLLPADPEQLPDAIEPPPHRYDPESLRLIIATSGSGGAPRGVMLTGRALSAATDGAVSCLGLVAGDLWLVCLPLFHIGGIAPVLRAECAGAGLVLTGRFDAVRVWDALHRHPVTHISLVPPMLTRLLDLSGDQPPPATLRVALVGGAGLSGHLAERACAARWPVWVSYGMSETGALIAARPVGAAWRAGRVGVPFPSVECAIADGRIRLRGPMLMAGYANPERCPGDGLAAGWFTTGDAGVFDSDELVVRGRADEVLVSGGENIHPEEIESLLAECPGVSEAAAAGAADPVWGRRVVLIYSGTAEPWAVERWCRERLAGAWRPRAFLRLDAMPRTGSGKLDRAALQHLVEDGSAGRNSDAPGERYGAARP